MVSILIHEGRTAENQRDESSHRHRGNHLNRYFSRRYSTVDVEDCEYDQLYFSTEHDSIAVKVYDLEKEESLDRFRHEE